MASDEEIRTLAVKIALDASSFTQQAASFKKQVSELDSGFKSSVAGIKNWGDTVDGLKSHVSTLGQQIGIQKQVVESYQEQIVKASAALQAHSEQLVQNKEKVTQLKSAYEQSAATLGKNADETKALKEQLDAAEQALSKSESQVRRNQDSVNGYGIQLNNATGKLKTMEAELKTANSALFDHTNAIATAGAALQKAGDKISNVGSKMSSAGMAMTTSITAPIAAAGVGLFELSEKFEDAENTIRRGTGETGESLEGLDGIFKQVYADLPTSMADASEAVTDLAKRTNLTGQALQDLSEQEISLAKITGSDLNTTIQSTTQMFQKMGVAPQDYAKALDYVYTVTEKTGISIDTLSADMVKYGTPLQEMGYSWQQSAAILGQFEKAGVNTQQVLGSMRIALGNFAKAGKDPVTALSEITEKIKDAGSTSEANADAISAFGARAGTEMAAAIRTGKLSVDDLLETLKNSPDSIDTAEKSTETLTDKWTKLKNQLGEKLEPVGEDIEKDLEKALPAIEGLADDAANLADKFTNLSPQTQDNILKFAALAAVAGPVVLGFGKIIGGVGLTVTALGKGASGVANFVKGVQGIEPAAGESVTSLGKIGMAIGPILTNPIGIATLAIAGIGTALGVVSYEIINAKQPIDDFVNSVNSADKAWAALIQQEDQSTSSDLAEINRAQTLYDTLNKLVDANGKVIGSKQQAKTLVDLINSTTGKQELTMIGSQVEKWGDAKKAIDAYIETEKAQILLDDKKGAYTAALTNLDKANSDQATLWSEIQDYSAKVQQEENKARTSGNFLDSLYLDRDKKELKSLEDSFQGNAKTVEGYKNTISTYEQAMAAEASGNYGKVQQLLENQSTAYSQAATKDTETLKQRAIAETNMLNKMVSEQANGDTSVTSEMIAAQRKRASQANLDYDNEAGIAQKGGLGIGQAFANGINSEKGNANSAGKSVGTAAVSGFNFINAASKNAGLSIGGSVVAGIKAQNGSMKSVGSAAGDSYLDGLRSIIDNASISSPNFNPNKEDQAEHMYVLHVNGANAAGTSDWRGGLSYINEKGGEIVNLPQHTQVIPHDVSMELARAVGQAVGNGGGKNEFNVAVHIYGKATASDGKAIAAIVSNEIARQVNAKR